MFSCTDVKTQRLSKSGAATCKSPRGETPNEEIEAHRRLRARLRASMQARQQQIGSLKASLDAGQRLIGELRSSLAEECHEVKAIQSSWRLLTRLGRMKTRIPVISK